MQVSVDETGSLTRKMTIAVPSVEFEGRIADRLKDTATRVSLPRKPVERFTEFFIQVRAL